MATRVIVKLPGERDYEMRIGNGVIESLGRDMRKTGCLANARDVLVITDENVAPLHLEQVKASLSQAGYRASDIVVPAGEGSKSLEVASEIWRAMSGLALGRDCVVVALGGGVVGDLAGFAASTYMRGVQVVHVPTTLLAMVDSSIGGKTAINLPEGKNLVGTFHQPSFVSADTSMLSTLPDREWRCGCAEIAKSAVIDSDDFFFWLADHALDLAGRNPEIAEQAVKRCVVFKAGVVAQDKTDSSGVRECLNYGHTLGHAIESVAGYGVFSHGAAIAEGMRFAAEVARDRGEASDGFVEGQGALLDDLNLGALEWRAPVSDMLAAVKRDKKAHGDDNRFVVASDVGRWRVIAISDDELELYLAAW